MSEQGRASGFSVASVAPSPPRRGEGVEVLSRRECLQLLAHANVGRVAVSVGALPTVLPVRFTLVGEDVVFPAVSGSELDVAVRDAVVAFEADRIDPATGWSVVVTGIATELCDEKELQPLRAVPTLAALEEPQCFFRIPGEMISGRRIPRAPLYVAGSIPAASASATEAGSAASDALRPPLDATQHEPIPPDECLRLLATEEVGRLAVVLAGQPLVFPLNYALDSDAVVFRTALGTKLEAITRSPVAFEVDRWAPSSGTGWSVVVEGIAQEVTSADAPGLRERLAALPVRPLAAGDRLHFVRIVPFSITGSRLRPATGTSR
ncbi:MAG TPA: pyridoxamine 5'-phosphate oxidase family protein [Acidimicrobiia bacterium]|jgi:nitroimidazol reductase NimA-like FMN-containing flavoprotein (pyridoxamine 5'-phosphate oxidase superfamily)